MPPAKAKTKVGKKMSVLFFRPGEDPAFGPLLQKCAGLSATKRTHTVVNVRYRLEQFNAVDTTMTAQVVRVREEYTPGKTRLDRDGVEAVDLDPGEYIGEETVLLYDSAINVLALQLNRFGICHSNLASYLRLVTGDALPSLAVVLDDEEISTRVKKFRRISKMEVEVAHAGPQKLAETGFSGAALSEIMNASGAQKLRLILKPEHGGHLEKASALIEKLFKLQDQSDPDGVLRAAKIEGASTTGETVLDLLEPKMMEHIRFEVGAGVRHVPYNDRLGAVQRAWQARKEQLSGLFR